MMYIGILTPVMIALAGMCAELLKRDTPRWRKLLIPLFAVLTLLSGGYSVYTTHAKKKAQEPWAAMQALHGRAVDGWALVVEADQTKDSAKLDTVMDFFRDLTVDATKSRAPIWFKGRVQLLGVAVVLWALAERYPRSSTEEAVTAISAMRLEGTPYEGRPAKLLSMLGFFRAEDFGPPHRVLLGYASDGQLELDASRLSKPFLLSRAHDFFVDVEGMAL
jgi:hypothetical protein